MNSPVATRICLIAMPWSKKEGPSAALGALKAYLRQRQPDVEVACRHEFINVAAAIGFPLYDAIADQCYKVGELLYLALLYPEKRANVRRQFVDWAASQPEQLDTDLPGVPPGEKPDWSLVFDALQSALEGHIDTLAAAVASDYDLIGLTTCFGQLFANLCLAKKVKELSPQTSILLGGSTISARVGPSIIEEYAFIDYIIQGEGERPLASLVENLDQADSVFIRGLLSRANYRQFPAGAPLWEVDQMDDLPYPEYDDYAELADHFGVGWALPIEGSRGCWWDRVGKTGDARKACYFCNLNVQWKGYRQKSVDRLVGEMDALTDKHKSLRVFFLDNIIRSSGIADFSEAIQKLGKDFQLFYEMRANIKPYEILLMKEAGLATVQFGIEGLSSSLLKRIGKGTTAILNLQAMKLCYELKITNLANLIVDFPGSTPREVAETRSNLLDYALPYEPLAAVPFFLGVGSTVESLPEMFPIANVRNSDVFKEAMPEETWKRVRLLDLSFDRLASGTDWTPVQDAVREWAGRHAGRTAPMLCYQDGASFITITDERGEDHREGFYDGLARDVYIYCMEIRSLSQIKCRFSDSDSAELQEALDLFTHEKLMFHEEGRYLSLAMAVTPEIAARRIRKTYLEEKREPVMA
jgi:ribosomal peptide maturation radical SAM protein 1